MANKRQGILLAIFCILLGALAYDFLVARSAAHKAYVVVQDLVEKQAKMAIGNLIDQAKVKETIGRAPSSTSLAGTSTVELYEWRGGNPFRTYKVYVVYAGQQKPFLSQVFENEEPSRQDLNYVEMVPFDEAEEFGGEPTGIAPGGGASGAAAPESGSLESENAGEKSKEENRGAAKSTDPASDSPPDPADPGAAKKDDS